MNSKFSLTTVGLMLAIVVASMPIVDSTWFDLESDSAEDEQWRKATSIYDFTVKDINNEEVKLDKYKGKVLLVVNVASKSGLTNIDYRELNELYSKYHDQGLEILAFPCNQFAYREPGKDVDIKEFIKKKNVKFDVFAKVDVNGKNAIPLYSWLKSRQAGSLGNFIKWNFSKFLINKEGIPVGRYSFTIGPLDMEESIKRQLAI